MTHLGCRLFTFGVILLFIVTGCSHHYKKGEAGPPTPAQKLKAQPQEPQPQRREVKRPKRTQQKAQTPRRAPIERKTLTEPPAPEQQPLPKQQPLTEWGEEE